MRAAKSSAAARSLITGVPLELSVEPLHLVAGQTFDAADIDERRQLAALAPPENCASVNVEKLSEAAGSIKLEWRWLGRGFSGRLQALAMLVAALPLLGFF